MTATPSCSTRRWATPGCRSSVQHWAKCRFAASCRSLIESVSTSARSALIPVISLAPAVAVFGSWSLSWCGTKYTPASRHRPIHSMHCDAMRLARSSFQKATAGTLPAWVLVELPPHLAISQRGGACRIVVAVLPQHHPATVSVQLAKQVESSISPKVSAEATPSGSTRSINMAPSSPTPVQRPSPRPDAQG